MDTSKVIRGVVNSGRYTVTAPIVKEDYGLKLKIDGVELPPTYQVDFSNDEHHGTSVTMIGNADGVKIPRQFIDTGKDVFAFLYWVGEDYGKTVYKFRIPNKVRPDRTDETPTPEEQSLIDQAIGALNEAVAQTAQDVISAGQSARSASNDADRAERARDTAQGYASNAQLSATQANNSASSAYQSASASAQSASQSAQIKADVEDLVDDAQGYADSASQSASQASASEQGCARAVLDAASAAAIARARADEASGYAQTASAKAQNASQSASTASQKATEASQSASQALTYKNDAESAKTASQTAQTSAESARDSAISAKDDAESARDEAQSIVDGISGKVEQIDSNTERIESLEDDRYKPYVVDSASGSIASFVDGADDIPLKSLIVNIEPVQDLHGYDSPWPAGGGANKFDGLWNGETTAYNTAVNLIPVTPNETYYVYAPNIASSERVFGVFYDADGQALGTRVNLGRNTTFIVPTDAVSLRLNVWNTLDVTNIAINYPSTVTTYSPYENLCPISGWTEVDVEQRGKNLLSPDVDSYTRGRSYIYNLNVVPNGVSARMTFTDKDTSVDVSGCYIGFIQSDYEESIVSPRLFRWCLQNGAVNANATNSATQNASYLCGGIFIYPNDIATFNKIFSRYNIMVELGSTATEYESYTGRSITIDLGQTVYGGKLDVLSGVLTVDRAMVDLGTLSWSAYDSNSRYVTRSIVGRAANANMICSQYWRTTASFVDMLDGSFRGTVNDLTMIVIRDTRYSSVADFSTAMSGVQLVYELATPITIQLTPNQVNSLLGVNNLWADSGDTEVEYRADTKAWIQRKIAEAIASLT